MAAPTFRVAEHEIAARADEGLGRHTTGLVPVYPATEGLSARRIRELAWACAAWSVTRSSRCRRGSVRGAPAWPGRRAVAPPTGPSSLDEVPVARRRLALEELFLFQLALVMRRRTRREVGEAEPLGPPGDLVRSWLESLPFELTAGQRQALDGDRRRPRERAARCSAC